MTESRFSKVCVNLQLQFTVVESNTQTREQTAHGATLIKRPRTQTP